MPHFFLDDKNTMTMYNKSMKEILIIAYSAVSALTIIAYWPTIKDLLAGKPSANATSYLIWTVAFGITLLYSIFVLTDFLFRFVSFVSFLSCFIILVLDLRLKKYRWKTKK
jgi:hypothetical protein